MRMERTGMAGEFEMKTPDISRCFNCGERFLTKDFQSHIISSEGMNIACKGKTKDNLVRNGFRLQSIVGQPQGYWSK